MTATAPPSPTSHGTVYTVLFAAALCHGINDTMQAVLLSVYPMLRDNYALTFAQIGMITLVFQVTASILQPFVGTFTDKYPLPYALPVAPLCTLTGLLLLATAHSYHAILIAAAMIGIGSSIFHPDASRVTRLSSGGRFGFAQSTFQVGGNVGTAVGPLLAAAIVLPRGQGAIAWFALFAVAAFVLLSFVGRWYARYLSQKRVGKAGNVAAHGLSSQQIVWALVVLMVLMFSKFVYTSSLHSFYSFYLIDHFGVTPQNAQIYLFVLFGAIAIGTFAGGPIGDKIGTKAVIWISIIGTLPFSLALPYANLTWTVALTVPIGLILSSAFSAMIVYAQELVPGRVGMISGMFFGLAFGLAGLGAAVLGMVADKTSIDFVFKLCSFLPALGFLAFLLPRTR
ncbi:MAG: MFS transporter [Phyllobacteriaceae bacterium]|nr:MFS transporter [Phyllobacteriaceae bacterium]